MTVALGVIWFFFRKKATEEDGERPFKLWFKSVVVFVKINFYEFSLSFDFFTGLTFLFLFVDVKIHHSWNA